MGEHVRMVTYMCPDMPAELYTTFKVCFEEVLRKEFNKNITCSLQVEEDYATDYSDIIEQRFLKDEVDLAFISSASYAKLLKEKEKCCDLLTVVPIYDLLHGRNHAQSYSDVIIHNSKADIIKTFDDLRGHKWAVTDSDCIFGYLGVLAELRTMGHNANFFGNFIHTKSQRATIEAVLKRDADGAAVEASVLKIWLKENPVKEKEIHILTSWGPYPPEPIVVNKNLPDGIKSSLSSALLKMGTEHPKFIETFKKFGIAGFDLVDANSYETVSQILELAQGEKLYPAYY